MARYAVVRERGPRWDGARPMREQDGWGGHAAFMDDLAEKGFVVLGGPVGDGEHRFLLIVEAETDDEIVARFAEDPWTPAGMLSIASIERWEILLGGD